MPDKVRLNRNVRRRQAADWVQRIMPEWEKIRDEIATIGDYELFRRLEYWHALKMLTSRRERLRAAYFNT